MLDVKHGHGSNDGFVLVVVIWLVGLIAAMATGFAVKVKLDTIAASESRDAAEIESIADGMARFTAWKVAKGDALVTDGSTFSCDWNNAAIVSISVQDQSGLVNLNVMPALVYRDLFEGIGVPRLEAENLAGELVDFRDLDHVNSSGGAEPALYPGQNYGPKNAPFQIIEELDQLPGLNEEWYRKFKPLVTTYSGQAAIDPQSAPAALRTVFGEPPKGPFSGKLAAFVGGTEGKTFEIHATARLKNGTAFQRKAMIVVLRQPDRPFATLEWARGVDVAEGEPADTAMQACIKD